MANARPPKTRANIVVHLFRMLMTSSCRAIWTMALMSIFFLLLTGLSVQTNAAVIRRDNDVKSLCMKYLQIALAALEMLAGRLRKCAELVEALSYRSSPDAGRHS